jgi:hypothetical protein
LQTLKKEHIWREGKGTSINIWQDEWIRRSHARTKGIERVLQELVCLLTRDDQLVNHFFWAIDARRVMTIPLPSHGMDDFVVCIFSVRAAHFAE